MRPQGEGGGGGKPRREASGGTGALPTPGPRPPSAPTAARADRAPHRASGNVREPCCPRGPDFHLLCFGGWLSNYKSVFPTFVYVCSLLRSVESNLVLLF